MKKSLLYFIAGCLYGCQTPAPQHTDSSKPNVIFILADDLGYADLSCYGQRRFSTPNIDKLASQGMMFSQHYSGATVCAPSRSALLTGLHTGHTPIRGNHEILPEGQYPLPDSLNTLAKIFKKSGYKTGAFGKWGLGFPGSEGDPNNQGFDEFYGYNCQRLAHHYYPHFLRDNQKVDSLEANFGKEKGAYAPNIIHDRAIDFMIKHKDELFFMFYPSAIPHAELVAPDSVMNKYRGKYLPENSYSGYDDGPAYRTGPYESQDESHTAFVAMVEILDHQVGDIMRMLDQLGIAENTIVVFTSDNGPHKEGGADPEFFNSNGDLKGFKRDLYEGGIRVPLIISWPNNIEKGSIATHISAFWDFVPTFSEIIEYNSNQATDGISMLPTMLGIDGQKQHKSLYWEFHELGGRQALRQGKWKAVKYNVFKDTVSLPELYDLESDIAEQYNLAEKYPDIATNLAVLMDSCRTNSEIFNFNGNNYNETKH